jgi:hypothetical protein
VVMREISSPSTLSALEALVVSFRCMAVVIRDHVFWLGVRVQVCKQALEEGRTRDQSFPNRYAS